MEGDTLTLSAVRASGPTQHLSVCHSGRPAIVKISDSARMGNFETMMASDGSSKLWENLPRHGAGPRIKPDHVSHRISGRSL